MTHGFGLKFRAWGVILAVFALLGGVILAVFALLGSIAELRMETATIESSRRSQEQHTEGHPESRDHSSADLDTSKTRYPTGYVSWQLLSQPVTVTVHADTSGEPPEPCCYVIELRDRRKTVRLETALTGVNETASALEDLRQAVAWSPPYLFVQLSCGGGNAWACNKVIVYKVDDGVARRVVSVATDVGRASDVFDGQYFIDVYDKLEHADGFSHANSPWFHLAIEDKGEGLAVSAGATWLLNYQHYRESDVFTQAVLCKYCGQQRKLQGLLESALPTLTGEDSTLLFKTLNAVVPLELPSAWRGND